MIRPINDVCIVKQKESVKQTSSGLYLPTEVKSFEGTIVAVGDEVSKVTVGDNVLLSMLTYMKTIYDGVEYLVVREKEIIGII